MPRYAESRLVVGEDISESPFFNNSILDKLIALLQVFKYL